MTATKLTCLCTKIPWRNRSHFGRVPSGASCIKKAALGRKKRQTKMRVFYAWQLKTARLFLPLMTPATSSSSCWPFAFRFRNVNMQDARNIHVMIRRAQLVSFQSFCLVTKLIEHAIHPLQCTLDEEDWLSDFNVTKRGKKSSWKGEMSCTCSHHFAKKEEGKSDKKAAAAGSLAANAVIFQKY